MLLKSLMEDKQLDFTQPFLSVRRNSSPSGVSVESDDNTKTHSSTPRIPPLPVYKSELKSGPVSNPGTVPFIWEKTPGRPKDERKAQNPPSDRPPIAPRLPPGRALHVKQQQQKQVPKKRSKTVASNHRSEEVKVTSNIHSIYSSDKNADGKKEGLKEAAENGEETYYDAVDRLSRTESFFMNCSISGISGLDGPDVINKSYGTGTFASDPQVRDFMMGRFLPAAKAMASETPPHASMKQAATVQREEPKPREIKKVIVKDNNKQRPLNPYAQKVLSHYTHDTYKEESDDEDDDNESEYSLIKACGLIPRFCLKSSFCLMNPIPRVRMQARPGYSVRTVRNHSSYPSTCSASSVKITESQRSERSNFRELLANEEESDSLGPVIEKTLYVDYVKDNKSSTSLDVRGGMKEASELDYSLHVIKDLNSEVQEKTMLMQNSIDSSSFLSCSDRAKDDRQLDLNESKSDDQGLIVPDAIELKSLKTINERNSDLESLNKDPIGFRGSKVAEHKKIDQKSSQVLESGVIESSYGLVKNSIGLRNSKVDAHGKNDLQIQSLKPSRQLLLVPPSPKSPSESWLKRTLPTVSSRNLSSSWLSPAGQINVPKSPDIKWEAVVKSSNLYNGQKEQLKSIPEA